MFWQNTLEVAENLIKQHEAFITTTDANDEKINAVLQFANRLIEDNHYAADKIHKKAENINERWDSSILYILYIKKDDLLDIVCMN
jgi:spectrin beta